ncbi:MAG: hypothetical protein Q4G03_02510 [Planctomycetia bacterium]|nr:hypothetical protein [Planctomycetia bacterium]
MSSTRSVFSRVIALAQVLVILATIALIATTIASARLLLHARLTASEHARARVATRLCADRYDVDPALLDVAVPICSHTQYSHAFTQRVATRAQAERQARLLQRANDYYLSVHSQSPERVDAARETILRGLARWGVCAELVDATFQSAFEQDDMAQRVDLQSEPQRQTSACQDAIAILEEFAQDQGSDDALGDALAFLHSFDQSSEFHAHDHDDWILWDFDEVDAVPKGDPLSHAGLVAIWELRQDFGDTAISDSTRGAIEDSTRALFCVMVLALPLATFTALLRVCALVKTAILLIVNFLADVVLWRLRTAIAHALHERVWRQPLALRDLASVRLLI